MDELLSGIYGSADQEFMESLPAGICPQCGDAVYQNKKGRRKIFCSEQCRYAWKNKHGNPLNWKSARTAVCPICGKEFIASREYKAKRKYCSRACANKGRAAERYKKLGGGESLNSTQVDEPKFGNTEAQNDIDHSQPKQRRA